jgi:hypothetical protein
LVVSKVSAIIIIKLNLIFYPFTVLMCQWFAPTKLAITFETEGMGALTKEDIDRYIIKDENGNPIALDLPTKFVLIANHQVSFNLLGSSPSSDKWLSPRFTPTGGMHGASLIS